MLRVGHICHAWKRPATSIIDRVARIGTYLSRYWDISVTILGHICHSPFQKTVLPQRFPAKKKSDQDFQESSRLLKVKEAGGPVSRRKTAENRVPPSGTQAADKPEDGLARHCSAGRKAKDRGKGYRVARNAFPTPQEHSSRSLCVERQLVQ